MYAYAILALSGVISTLAVAYILISMSLPKREHIPELGETVTVSVFKMESRGKIFTIENTKPPASARWLLLAGTCFFLYAIFNLSNQSTKRIQTGASFPVEHLADKIAVLVEDERQILIGKRWTKNDDAQDVAVELTFEGGRWQFDVSGDLPDIEAAFIMPAGPFATCEEVPSYAEGYREFQLSSEKVIADVIWIYRDYLRYPDGQPMELSVMDDRELNWRPAVAPGTT